MYASRYATGKRFVRASQTRLDWFGLSFVLFGHEGLLSNLFSKDAFGPGFLGTNGLFIAATLDKSSRPLSVNELAQYLGFFMSRQTVKNVLFKMSKQSPPLAVNIGEFWESPSDFLQALKIYEANEGPDERSKKTHESIQLERAEHGVRVKGGLLTSADERKLKTSCIRNKTHKKPLEVEHFPPKKFLIKWRQKDHIDLSWGICANCNKKYGKWIKKHSAPKLDKLTPIKITVKAGLDPRRAVLARLETNLRRFYISVDNGDDVKALKLIVDSYRLWLAVIEAKIPVQVTQINTDGSTKTPFVNKGKSVRKKTGEIGKRKTSSRIVRHWPDGPARGIQKKWQTESDD